MSKILIHTLLILHIVIGSISAQNKGKIDFSSCYDMLKILEKMKKGNTFNTVSEHLDSLLKADAYQVMFKHYNRTWRPNHLPKDVFKRMILSLQFPDQYEKGENNRADQMLEYWVPFFNDLSLYRKKLSLMKSYNLHKMIPTAIEKAQNWLPPEMKVHAFDFYVLPHGGSGGFIIGNATGYDLFKLEEDKDEFQNLITHETHHFGLNIISSKLQTNSDTLAFMFLSYFIGEGTAVKFINNFPGGHVPSVSKGKITGFKYPGLSALWEDYTKHEQDIFNHMFSSFEKICEGKLTEEELNKELRNYWMTGIMGKQYFVGSEIFGAIYYGLGKEACFEAMQDPRKLFEIYNKALKEKPDLLSNCPKVPEKIVRMALSIGA